MVIRNINYETCTACSYPVDTRLDTFIVDLDASVINKQEKSPCQAACPAGVNIPALIHLLKGGRFEEAMKLLREALPFPAIMGHVCFHPCESECARKDIDEAVNINCLERCVADHYLLKEKAQRTPKAHREEVAIVGSGPAGLSAAHDLSKAGYPVTVFEAMSAPGGMLRYGIPEYRLPTYVLDAQIDYIKDIGVEFKTNVTLGKDITVDELKERGYQAVVLATGTQLSRRLEIEGIELDGVLWGLDFLRNVNLKREVEISGKVVVVGGGDVAIDSARTALRLGAKEVELVCLESREEMPAHKEYIQQALEEGMSIGVSWGPKRILGNEGRTAKVQFACCTSVFDEESRFDPCFDESKTKIVEADTVIIATGQVPDVSCVSEDVWKRDGSTIQVGSNTQVITLQGVFACGDVVSGPMSVVEAVASGKRAASYVERFLKGEKIKEEVEVKRVEKLLRDGVAKKARQKTPLLPVDQRRRNFKEVKIGFNKEMVCKESERCMVCGVQGNCTEVCPMDVLRMDDFLRKPVIRYPEDCMTCYNCERSCPMGAISVDPIQGEISSIID